MKNKKVLITILCSIAVLVSIYFYHALNQPLIDVVFQYGGVVDDTYYDPFTYFKNYDEDQQDKKVVYYYVKVKNINKNYNIYILKHNILNNGDVKYISYENDMFDGYIKPLKYEEEIIKTVYCIVDDDLDENATFDSLKTIKQFVSLNVNGVEHIINGQWIYSIDSN